MTSTNLAFVAQPLYNYLRGNNDRQLQIDMAKPAIIDIRPNKDFSSTGTNYTVLFYLPGLSEASHCDQRQLATVKMLCSLSAYFLGQICRHWSYTARTTCSSLPVTAGFRVRRSVPATSSPNSSNGKGGSAG